MQLGTRISGGPYNYGVGIVTNYEPGNDGSFIVGAGLRPVTGYVDVQWPTHESKHLPVQIVASLPYHIHTDRLGTAEEIASLRAEAAIHAASEAAKKDEAATARAALRARLLAEYPRLLRPSATLDSLNCAAKNMRAMLKAAFPGVKFTVRSERYSGGCSINVNWTDGPASSAVKAITDPFQEGDFDGMTDYHESRHSVWCDLFGDAKYVFENRHHSRAALLVAVEKVKAERCDPRIVEELANAYDSGNLYGDDEWTRREISQALGYV